jgi:ribosome-binding ATPase YchF (GTP1/OBG family)
MPESTPNKEKVVTRKELFRSLHRHIGRYADIDAKLPEKYKQGKHNTSVALNLLLDFVNDNLPLPSDWSSLAITSQTPFFFIKDREGVIVSNVKEHYFSTPTEFIKSLQKFYDLGNLIAVEEQEELAAAKAAKEAKEKADLAAIRSGKWREAHMPESLPLNESAKEAVTPRRFSVFRPKA